MTLSERLLNAALLIDQGWTKGTSARDRPGYPVLSSSPKAVMWCLLGALSRVGALIPVYCAFGLVKDFFPPGCTQFVEFNDAIAETKDDVIDILLWAAAAAED